MKKLTVLLAAASIVLSASAEKTAVTASKAGDNIYVGINAGTVTDLRGSNSFDNFQPSFGVRVGKNFTTVLGFALEGDISFNAHDKEHSSCTTLAQQLDVAMMGTVNLSNLIAGYKGRPRDFEFTALGGFGWTHLFGRDAKLNYLVSRLAIDFAYNLGKYKEWQVYIEPSVLYGLEEFNSTANMEQRGVKYNVNNAQFALRAGLNYKFGCSNGTHNFAIEALSDKDEIDGLNAKINALRSEYDTQKAEGTAKDATVSKLQKALADCENLPAPEVKKGVTHLQPLVLFAQGESTVENSQYANIELIAKYMQNNKNVRVKISGYASPEGTKEYNRRLSERRAEAVKTILVKKYKVAADRIETEGLGATDGLFDQVEFNRVSLFNDTTK